MNEFNELINEQTDEGINLLLLKQLAILSGFAGVILGLVTVVPYISAISFFILMTCISAFILVYLKQNDLIGIVNVKEGCIFGSVIGFVSCIAFSVAYLPISMLLGWLIPSYTQGFMRFFLSGGFLSIFVMLCLVILLALISAGFNGLSGAVTAYIYELITGIKKEANQNNSVDFEIK